jgi:uncharacterized protein YbjT (DUF2867 family)
MTRVAIFGATTKLGQELVTAALLRELEINAVEEDARKMTRQHEAITTIEADLSTGKGIEAAVSGCRSVIWSLAVRRSIARKLRSLADELARHRIPKRLIFVSRLGVRPELGAASGLVAFLRSLHVLPGTELAELSRAEAVLRTGNLSYVIVRPAGFSDGRRKRRLVAVGPQDPLPGPLSRAELASFVIGLLDQDVWDRREIVVGSTDEYGGAP